MKNNKILSSAIFMAVSLNTNAALVERLNGQAYYDDVRDITWLANANMAGGPLTWYEATDWASGLNVDGVTGWRLPDYYVSNGELRYMFYDVLGGTSGVPINISHNSNYDLFSNIVPDRYWYGQTQTNCTGDPTEVCGLVFSLSGGYTDYFPATYPYFYAWAVHDGDVVPLPAAAWLFLSGLAGLGILSRKKN